MLTPSRCSGLYWLRRKCCLVRRKEYSEGKILSYFSGKTGRRSQSSLMVERPKDEMQDRTQILRVGKATCPRKQMVLQAWEVAPTNGPLLFWDRLSLIIFLWLLWNLLSRPYWFQTQRATCLCLLSVDYRYVVPYSVMILCNCWVSSWGMWLPPHTETDPQITITPESLMSNCFITS